MRCSTPSLSLATTMAMLLSPGSRRERHRIPVAPAACAGDPGAPVGHRYRSPRFERASNHPSECMLRPRPRAEGTSPGTPRPPMPRRELEGHAALVECFNPATNTCPLLGTCKLRGLFRQGLEAFSAEPSRSASPTSRGTKPRCAGALPYCRSSRTESVADHDLRRAGLFQPAGDPLTDVTAEHQAISFELARGAE